VVQTTLLEVNQLIIPIQSRTLQVLVGRTDPNFKPDIIDLKIDGVALKESERKVENGKIILNKRFSRPGH
jgi:hypothetical protein